MPSSNKRAAPFTSPHFDPSVATSEPPSKKRKMPAADTPKYYAVHVGKKPGVYQNWVDCQKQIIGFPGASFKSFLSRKDAADFVAGRPVASAPQSVRYYGYIAGNKSGVTTDWPTVERLIVGQKGPKYKKFETLAEAEAFVVQHGGVLDEVEENGGESEEEELAVIKKDKPAKAKAGSKNKTAPAQKQTTAVVRAPLIVYSDGSALSNGKANARAGVGVYFGPGDPRNVSERLKGLPQTNQRAELTAVLRTLQALPETEPLVIRTDSMYSINCITKWSNKWKTNDWRTAAGEVKNRDLVEAIREIYDKRLELGTVTEFEWVKGHAGHPGNEAADRLANQGALMLAVEDDGEL